MRISDWSSDVCSSDLRRAVRDHVYAAIRRAGERPDSGRVAMVGLARAHPHIAALFNGSPHGPAPIVADEPGAMASTVPSLLLPVLAPLLDAEEEQTKLLERDRKSTSLNSSH